jgi:uncharacterized spore protein YtfJ
MERRRAMEAEIQKMLDMLAELREKASVNACFGEPVTAGDRTVIPVARVGYGFGMGLGSGSAAVAQREKEGTEETAEDTSGASGGGGGGGAGARPLAIIEVTPDSTCVKHVVDEQKIALAGSLLAGWATFWLAWALAKIFAREK